MKKLFYLLGILNSISSLTSCEINETLVISESGEVNYENSIDYSQMIGFMFTEEAKDSMRLKGEFPIDTLINFADFDKVSSLRSKEMSQAEKDFMKSLDKSSLRMVMNDDVGRFVIGMKEKDVKSFNAYMKKVNDSYVKFAKQDPEAAGELDKMGVFNPIEFTYDGGKFSRKGLTKAVVDIANADAETVQMLQMFTYKLEYKFPKKIKSTNLEGATFSADRKSIIVESPLLEVTEHPEKYNFTVEFE